MSKSVLYEQDKRIVKITLNRPDTRNALSGDIIEELVEYLNKADKDKDVGCIILTGAGKSFSSGGNLQEIKDMTTKDNMSLSELEDWYRFGIQRIPRTMNSIDVPIVAAVNGHAIGAGNDLCTMCDIRIAGEDANWGRIIMAVGKSGQPANRDKIKIYIGDEQVTQNGMVYENYSELRATEHLKQDNIFLEIDVGVGKSSSTVYTCDLTHKYIDINADYRS